MFNRFEISPQSSILDTVEEVEPTQEELDSMSAYRSGDPDYQPFMSQEDLMQKVGL